MQYILDLAQGNLTTFWGILLYWCPLALCTVGYIVRTFEDVQQDLHKRQTEQHYYPSVTIGTLIGRGLASIVPVVNLMCATFDVAPKLFGSFFEALGRVFNQPLVPKRYK